MYKCRQVQCPLCNHLFMWIEYADLPASHYVYKRESVDEKLGSTHCPKCTYEMIVVEDSVRGISIDDDSVVIIGTVRGI